MEKESITEGFYKWYEKTHRRKYDDKNPNDVREWLSWFHGALWYENKLSASENIPSKTIGR